MLVVMALVITSLVSWRLWGLQKVCYVRMTASLDFTLGWLTKGTLHLRATTCALSTTMVRTELSVWEHRLPFNTKRKVEQVTSTLPESLQLLHVNHFVKTYIICRL